jgi:hypothetical protein
VLECVVHVGGFEAVREPEIYIASRLAVHGGVRLVAVEPESGYVSYVDEFSRSTNFERPQFDRAVDMHKWLDRRHPGTDLCAVV